MKMAGSVPALLAVIILQLTGNIQVNEALSIRCPYGEKICGCPDDKPKDPFDPWGGFIYYCSVGGECKPEENGCPPGKNRNVQKEFTP